jgi:hypothetical protein
VQRLLRAGKQRVMQSSGSARIFAPSRTALSISATIFSVL